MKIEDMLRLEDTDRIHADRSRKPIIVLDEEDKGRVSNPMPSLGVSREYSLTLSVGVRIVANSAQLSDKRRVGLIQIQHTLYSDIRGDVLEALQTTEDCDVQMILTKILEKIDG